MVCRVMLPRNSHSPRMTGIAPLLLTALAGACSVSLPAQDASGHRVSNRPAFEVISIHGHPPGYWPTFERKSFSRVGFNWRNATAQAIIVYAYDLRDPKLGPNLIPVAPKWIRSEWYDISARLSEADAEKLSKMQPKECDAYQRQLLQSLLIDRFNLKAHLISKESRAYELVVDKNGPRNLDRPHSGEEEGIDWVDSGDGQYHAVHLNALITLLQMLLDCPVEDRTGLSDTYDFELKWERDPETFRSTGFNAVPSAPSDQTSRPPIFRALQEELGLKLLATKAPLQSIVIDHIEKPSPN
jgi:uncharacterized protein (TIGR03435 family)